MSVRCRRFLSVIKVSHTVKRWAGTSSFDRRAKSPKGPREVRFARCTYTVYIVRKCSQHETCFSRDYGRVFRVSFLTKHSKPLRAGKVRMGRARRATPRKKIADIKQQFTAFRQQCVSNYAVPKKSRKTKVVKVPYSLPMKFVTLNFRGVNGDSGILKRQRLVRVMSEQKYDVVPLSEIQVNSSSFEASRDCLFFFSSDVLPEQADREHAGVGIGAH